MTEDLAARFQELTESDEHNPNVQYELGRCYLYGEGTEPDGEQALRYLSEAAAQGHALARALLGQIQPARQDAGALSAGTLMDWCAAAEDGDPEAQYQVAMYFAREGSAENDVIRYLNMAVAQGHPQACMALGRRIRQQDPNEAEKLFQNAADCGVAAAFTLLGEIYSGRNNLERAVEYFEQGAQLGGSEAMLELAVRFASGDGLPASQGKAMSWLKRAQDAGLEDAQAQFRQQMDQRRAEAERQRQLEEEAAWLELQRQEEAARLEQQRQEEARLEQERQEEARRERERQEAARREQERQLALREREAQRAAERREGLKERFLWLFHSSRVVRYVTLGLGLWLACTVIGTLFNIVVTTHSVLTMEGVDAFAEISVHYTGAAPFGKVDVINNSGYPSLQNARITAVPEDGLSNGDTVTVTVECSARAAKEDNIRIKNNKRTFKVEGLNSYVTDPSQIDDASMEAMAGQAADLIESYLTNTSASVVLDHAAGHSYASQVSYGTLEAETSYLLTLKQGFSADNVNVYNLIYKIPAVFTNYYDAAETLYDGNVYFAVAFYQLSQTPEGVTEVSLPMASLKDPAGSLDQIYTGRVSAFKDSYNVVEIPVE